MKFPELTIALQGSLTLVNDKSSTVRDLIGKLACTTKLADNFYW
jgi:hypothetical protein